MQIKPTLLYFFLFISQLLVAQSEIKPPSVVRASDGTFSNYVLVRWNAPPSAQAYKIYRSTGSINGQTVEISNEWQRSTLLYDYGAAPGVRYFYRVIANFSGVSSAQSIADLGYVKNNDPIAANFTPSEYLEPLLSNSRSSTIIARWDTPTADSVYFIGLDQTIAVSGLVSNANNLDVSDLRLEIYDNQEASYLEENPVLTAPLADEFETISKQFDIAVDLPTTPGLYYLLIVDEEGEAIAARRIIVE